MRKKPFLIFIAVALLIFGVYKVALPNNSIDQRQLSTATDALNNKDYPRAMELFLQLAKKDSTDAMVNVGVMYEYGYGVKTDLFEAFRWYKLAAEKGSEWGQVNLGVAYREGRGVQKSDIDAFKWFGEAGSRGEVRAQRYLGRMYREGRGLPSDRRQVIKVVNTSNLMYVERLKKDFGNRLHFESAKAERIVKDFDLDCQNSSDSGRHLPLINALYARLPRVNSEKMWLETRVQEKGGDVRIIDVLTNKTGAIDSTVMFEINRWGDLVSVGGVRVESFLNACNDSHGPIWLLK